MFAMLDLDDTLVDKSQAFGRWAIDLVESMSLGESALAWLISADRAVRQRELFFAEVVRRWPELGSAQALWDDYAQAMPLLVEPFPGVTRQLAELREAGFRLAVVTNGRRDNQEAKLNMTGLAALVDTWVISEVVGYRKPAVEIYEAALRAVGCSDPARCWMVGDDPALDIAPAAARGMRTAWVSHGRSWVETGIHPDVMAESPAHALAALVS